MFSCSLPSFIDVGKKCGEIAGVHLAGVVGNAAGQVDGTDDGDAVNFNGFSGAGEFAIAAALGGKIDDDRTGRHAFDHFGSDQHGRFLAGNHGGGNDDVAFGDDAA